MTKPCPIPQNCGQTTCDCKEPDQDSRMLAWLATEAVGGRDEAEWAINDESTSLRSDIQLTEPGDSK